MIWDNIVVMSVIDVAVIAIVVRMFLAIPRDRGETLSESGPGLIGLGVILIGLFYFADLVTMLVLPRFLGMERAMEAMLYLHLDVRWIVSLLSLVLIFAGFIGVIRDRRQASELLQHAQKREIVGQLASGVAHDFNNTITVIAGNAEMALKGLSKSDPARAELEEILLACDQACKISRQLLTFSQSDSHEPERIDLSELVRRAEPMLRRAVGEDVRLHFSLAKTLDAVEADPGKIEQALLNLVINARDATAERGEIVVATEKAFSDGNAFAVIRVTDNGFGIAEKIRSRVFEPFFTTKAAGGTGLGLAMTQNIVEESGGQISLESEPGVGTTFRIKLPTVSGPASARVSPVESAVLRSAPLGAGLVLVVEDQDPVRRLVVRSLEMLGYEVVEARDGEHALSLYRASTRPFDLVLTDVRMPRMNGLELSREIRNERSDQPVVFISGNRGSLEDSKTVSMDYLLEKPYTQDQLAEIVELAVSEDRQAVTG